MKNRKLVVSTGNKHKLDEIKDILGDLDIEVISKNDIGLGEFDIIEDGDSLEYNSLKKARALSELTDYMVLADDTGLFVDALNGEPGVFSSRYAGEEANDEKNRLKLLKNMENIPLEERDARFKTVIALITEDKDNMTVEGICEGSIGFDEKGRNGFGYDSIFIPKAYDKTFAELDADIKNKISHRAKALENLRDTIVKILDE